MKERSLFAVMVAPIAAVVLLHTAVLAQRESWLEHPDSLSLAARVALFLDNWSIRLLAFGILGVAVFGPVVAALLLQEVDGNEAWLKARLRRWSVATFAILGVIVAGASIPRWFSVEASVLLAVLPWTLFVCYSIATAWAFQVFKRRRPTKTAAVLLLAVFLVAPLVGFFPVLAVWLWMLLRRPKPLAAGAQA